MNALHPKVVIAWRVSAALTVALLSTALAALELLVLSPRGLRLLAPGLATGLVAIAGLALAMIWPTLRYRFWSWEVRDDQVVIQRGVVWRSRTLVPRVRIQHVDTRTSPLQRWLGLSSLILYTAGTHGSDVEIPGLTAGDAERLRDELAQLEELDEPGS